jgi:hypothetical protein
MKLIFAFALVAIPITSAGAATSLSPEPGRREIVPMTFAQCTDLIQDYKGEFGTPQVILDVPTLRIVQFAVQSQTEQVTCDGESDLVTVFEIDDQ